MTIEESTLIRPIYTELQGILTQMPEAGFSKVVFLSKEDVQPIFDSIEELISVANESVYDRYCPVQTQNGYNSREIRIKLSALILRLYGQYFPTEPQPFSGQPAISVNQYQTQKQELTASFVYIINYKLDQAIEQSEKKEDKKLFEKIKQAIQVAKDVKEVAQIMASVAASLKMAERIPELLQRFL